MKQFGYLLFLLWAGCNLPGPDAYAPDPVPDCSSKKVYSITLLPDFSGSGGNHHIPTLQLRQIVERPLQELRKAGGQLAVGLVDGSSDKTLCTCRISKKGTARPELPRRADYRNDLAFNKAWTQYRKVKIPNYKKARERLAREVEQRIEQFRTCLDAMQKRKHNVRATDLHGAINRSIIAHQQMPKASEWHTVLISDGRANRQTQKIIEDTSLNIQTWCAYCQTKIMERTWFKTLKPRITTDLQSTLDAIFEPNQF